MKHIFVIFLMCIGILLTSCSNYTDNATLQTTGISEEEVTHNVNDAQLLSKVKEHIIFTENIVKHLFSNDIENEIIGEITQPASIKNIDVYKYTGPNATFKDVCNETADLCVPAVADKLIREVGYVNIDGQIGFVAATGEATFSVFDEQDMKLLSCDGNVLAVEITKYTEERDYAQEYLYTMEICDDQSLIITAYETQKA